MPLMPGLELDEEQGVAFDAPSGRIVEAVAVGAVPAPMVEAFYNETLPQLGWEPVSGEFRRDDEVLRLEISAEERETTVRFFLTPAKQ